jgi:hypothetical protein
MKYNHDSWGICTTSVECRTIMTVMLTFMSGMDAHTIRVTWIGMVGMLGWFVSLFFKVKLLQWTLL